MLVLAAFLSISAVFVAFLLRFVFALEADVRSRKQHPVRVERIWTHRMPSLAVAQGSASGLALVHSNPRMAPQARVTLSSARPQEVGNSRVKQA
jgi:hypothetical protein